MVERNADSNTPVTKDSGEKNMLNGRHQNIMLQLSRKRNPEKPIKRKSKT